MATPSGRDIELYQAVKYEVISTRAAAERFDVSQTRVRQIVASVARWVKALLPESNEVGQARDLRYAQHVAAERLQAMLQKLMILWNIDSDPKYQKQIQRVIGAQARLGVADGQFDELVAEHVGDLPHDGPIDTWPVETPPVNPPDGDCSPSVDSHTLDTLRAISSLAADRYENMVSGYAQALAELAELRQMQTDAPLLSPAAFENVHPSLVGDAVAAGQLATPAATPEPPLDSAMST